MRKVLLILLVLPLLVSAENNDQHYLRDLDGAPAAIVDHAGKGKWLLVMIWATDCSVCYQTAPGIVALHRRHKDTDVTVLGVALDGFEQQTAVRMFIDERKLSFPNLIAEMPGFALNYELEVGEPLLGTPTYLLFSPDGILVANNPGPVKPATIEQFIADRSSSAITVESNKN